MPADNVLHVLICCLQMPADNVLVRPWPHLSSLLHQHANIQRMSCVLIRSMAAGSHVWQGMIAGRLPLHGLHRGLSYVCQNGMHISSGCAGELGPVLAVLDVWLLPALLRQLLMQSVRFSELAGCISQHTLLRLERRVLST